MAAGTSGVSGASPVDLSRTTLLNRSGTRFGGPAVREKPVRPTSPEHGPGASRRPRLTAVDFEDDAQLDTSQISDQRGGAGAGGAEGGLGTGLGGAGLGGGGLDAGTTAVVAGGVSRLFGGGIAGVIAVVVVLVLLNSCSHSSSTTGALTGGGTTTTTQPGGGSLAASCKTGADADAKAECRIVAAVNSVQKYWTATLAGGKTPYRSAKTVFFSGRTSTACGAATSATGPFYCPADQRVYLDLGFFDQLRRDFGAQGGPFAETYVVAHEYGHHVQHLLGFDTLVGRDRQGATSGSVKLELQADCFAGVWARNATRTGIVAAITQQDVADGLDAASVIGDDRIQQATGQRVRPESFTHGTSAQRQRWFSTGYSTGDPNRCDTWNAPSL